MLTRNSYAVWWQYRTDLEIAANMTIKVGCDSTTQSTVLCKALPYFSLDVYTDNVVEVDIETGMLEAALAPMATLICAPVLQHNTIYDLAPPFNRDGFLILTGNYMRIRVRNPTGAVVAPFNLSARLWR